MATKKGATLVLIYLIVSLPFCASFTLADTGETPSPKEIIPTQAGDRCVLNQEKSNAFADLLENDVISTIESVFTIAYAICTTMSIIDNILSLVATVFVIGQGGSEGGCCNPALLATIGGAAVCEGNGANFRAWQSIYANVRPVCCFVSCSTCLSGTSCFGVPAGGLGGSDSNANIDESDVQSNSNNNNNNNNNDNQNVQDHTPQDGEPKLGEKVATTGLNWLSGGVTGAGINTIAGTAGDRNEYVAVALGQLSPYDNIYLATACLCPGAILFNLRKLKTIYDTYNCCIEESCSNGISSSACERQLSEATCMYWQGSLYKMFAKIIMGMVAKFIASQMARLFGETFANFGCFIALIDLIRIPQMITQLLDAWQMATHAFEEPTCSDLNFDDIPEQLDPEPIFGSFAGTTTVDLDGDGKQDNVAAVESYVDNNGMTWTKKAAVEQTDAYWNTMNNPNMRMKDDVAKTSLKWDESATDKTFWVDENNVLYERATLKSDAAQANFVWVPITIPNTNYDGLPSVADGFMETIGWSNDQTNDQSFEYATQFGAKVNYRRLETPQGPEWFIVEPDVGLQTDQTMVDQGWNEQVGGSWPLVGEQEEQTEILYRTPQIEGQPEQWESEDGQIRDSETMKEIEGENFEQDVTDKQTELTILEGESKAPTGSFWKRDTDIIADGETDEISVTLPNGDTFVAKDWQEVSQQDQSKVYTIEIPEEKGGGQVVINEAEQTMEVSGNTNDADQENVNKKVNLRQSDRQQLAEIAAYQVTWTLLNYALEEFGYPYIDDMCREDWDASEPEQDNPTNVISTGPPTDPEQAETANLCQGSTQTMISADLIEVNGTQGNYDHEYTYFITACKGDVRVRLILVNNENSISLDDIDVPYGQTAGRTVTTQQDQTYDRLCLATDDASVGEKCFT